MNKKIFILTEGGGKLGFGHIARCLSLYQAFEESGIEAKLIINGVSAVRKVLGIKKCIFLNWLRERAGLFDLIHGADAVIVDSYLAGRGLYKSISGTAGTSVYMDDNNRLEYPGGGIIVNGSIYAEEMDYGKNNRAACLLGTRYAPLRKEFRDIPEKEIKKEIKNILITFGGNSNPGLIRKIAADIGSEFGFRPHIVDAARKRISAKEIAALMLKSDIAVCGGGQTICELARAGVPALGLCMAENQHRNLMGWHEAGFIDYCGWWNDKDAAGKINIGIRGLLSYKERLRRCRIGRQHVDGKGSLRIRDFILDR